MPRTVPSGLGPTASSLGSTCRRWPGEVTGYDVGWSADGSTGVGRRSATGSRDRRPSRPTACPRRPRTGVTQWRWGLSLSPPSADPALNSIELLHIAAEGYALNGTEDYGAAIGRHGTARPR